MRPPNPGVYVITNSITGRRYVGSSQDTKNRWWAHRGELKRQVHPSQLMQSDYNQYGIESFTFELHHLSSDPLVRLQTEQDLINRFDSVSPNGYNSTRSGKPGVPEGWKHSDESKAKISLVHKGKVINDEYRKKLSQAATGRVVSESTRLKMKEAHKAKSK